MVYWSIYRGNLCVTKRTSRCVWSNTFAGAVLFVWYLWFSLTNFLKENWRNKDFLSGKSLLYQTAATFYAALNQNHLLSQRARAGYLAVSGQNWHQISFQRVEGTLFLSQSKLRLGYHTYCIKKRTWFWYILS